MPDFLENVVITLEPSVDIPDVVISNTPTIILGENLCFSGDFSYPVWDFNNPISQVKEFLKLEAALLTLIFRQYIVYI